MCVGGLVGKKVQKMSFSEFLRGITEFMEKYRLFFSLVFFIFHVIDVGSDIVMCIMLHHASFTRLYIASTCSLVLSLVFTIFYDAVILLYVFVFGDVVAETFRLNRRVMKADLYGGFVSFFLGPLTPFILSEEYNTKRLTNRLSIVTAISEDIPQAIIAFVVLFSHQGWNSKLAFIQILSSLVAGLIKYFAGIFFESNRKSFSATDAQDQNGLNVPVNPMNSL